MKWTRHKEEDCWSSEVGWCRITVHNDHPGAVVYVMDENDEGFFFVSDGVARAKRSMELVVSAILGESKGG